MSFWTAVGVAAVAAGATHLLVKRFWPACVIAALAGSCLTHVIWTLRLGYFDGWFLISFFTVAALSLAVGIPVGYLVRRRGRG